MVVFPEAILHPKTLDSTPQPQRINGINVALTLHARTNAAVTEACPQDSNFFDGSCRLSARATELDFEPVNDEEKGEVCHVRFTMKTYDSRGNRIGELI